MRRAQFAEAIGISEKWVHNAAAALGRSLPYTISWARRMTVARAIQAAVPVSLPAADRLAATTLAKAADQTEIVTCASVGGVSVTVDLAHILSAFAIRLACAEQREPRRPGRPARTGAATRPGARERATAYGIDLSLVDDNLRRTPEERLHALDRNAALIGALRRRRAS